MTFDNTDESQHFYYTLQYWYAQSIFWIHLYILLLVTKPVLCTNPLSSCSISKNPKKKYCKHLVPQVYFGVKFSLESETEIQTTRNKLLKSLVVEVNSFRIQPKVFRPSTWSLSTSAPSKSIRSCKRTRTKRLLTSKINKNRSVLQFDSIQSRALALSAIRCIRVWCFNRPALRQGQISLSDPIYIFLDIKAAIYQTIRAKLPVGI